MSMDDEPSPPTGSLRAGHGESLPIWFQVWGSRGSRNQVGSRIGNSTSCYSLAVGQDLFVFDAGSGLLALSAALAEEPRLKAITRVHLLVTHAHWDHWDGLKDAEWMWRKNNGLALSILAPKEAHAAIAAVFEPPSFVRLEVLAMGTLASLRFVELAAGDSCDLPGAKLEVLALHHYSGMGTERRYLDTLGYRLVVNGGPTVVYMCDHEPTESTRDLEDAALASADLAVVDASYGDCVEHAFGHGSIESATHLALRHPTVRLLAAHHGPLRTDDEIENAARRHASKLNRFGIACEGATEIWDASARRFVPISST